jgi:glycosyltransferase involved in cell wall biosynthesis
VVRSIPTFEWLTDGETALKAGDVDGFVDALRTLVADEDRRADLGAAAARASEAYELDAVAEDLLAVYDGLV